MPLPTILCAQDDQRLGRVYEQTLSAKGYRVFLVHDGESVLTAACECQPDLVLLDVLLPKCDGFEVLKAIRDSEEGESVPVILLSAGRISPQYRERASALGAVSILSKPVALDELAERVEAVVKPPLVASMARREESPAELSGTFEELDLASLLHQIHDLRANGVLMLDNQKNKKKAVQFKDGYPVAVKSNLISECFGNMLVRRGQLSQEALDESISRVKQGEGLQGEILIAMDLLEEDDVSRVLLEQAEEKLFEVFSWSRGSFRFVLGRRLQRANALALEGSPANLILRGAREYLPSRKLARFIRRYGDRYLSQGNNPFYRLQSIDLFAADEKVISQLDGSQKLSDYSDAPEEVQRTLYALVAVQILELRSDPGAAGESRRVSSRPGRPGKDDDPQVRAELTAMAQTMRDQNHYELLGIPTTASDDEVHAAYEARAARVHPDRFVNATGAVRRLADEVYSLLSRARENLATADQRMRYAQEVTREARESKHQEAGRRALSAENSFQRAEALMRCRDFETALFHFGRAIEQYPEEGEYYAHYGWCLHLCHPDNEVMIEEAIEHVQRGVKLARDRENPYLFLGRLYRVVGKTEAAEKMFTRAVQIRPDCVEALRELRLMNIRRGKSKGILRRLLRR